MTHNVKTSACLSCVDSSFASDATALTGARVVVGGFERVGAVCHALTETQFGLWIGLECDKVAPHHRMILSGVRVESLLLWKIRRGPHQAIGSSSSGVGLAMVIRSLISAICT
ncbi:MAG: hypothetical protein P8X69_09300, partial [Maritimibacter sp.]